MRFERDIMMKCSSKSDKDLLPDVFLEDGILHLNFGFKGRVTKRGILHALDHADAKSFSQLPVMLYGNRIIYVDYDAASFASDRRVRDLVGAMAIVTVTPLEKLLGQMFLQLHRPPYPVKLFPRRHNAFNWLQEKTLAENALVR